MAAQASNTTEKPNIEKVINNVVTVSLPYLEGTMVTYLTASVAATGTTLTVKDNVGFANNDYIILGDVGSEQTEIVKIGGAVTTGTSITIGATVFPHPVGTKVTLIRYNQVAIYESATSDDAAPTIIGSAVDLDVSKGNNEIVATTTDSYYYARYYNEQTSEYSQYSDSVAAEGLGPRTRGEIKLEFLSMYNEQYDDLVTDDWLNRAINRWQRTLNKRRRQWSVLRATSISNLVQDQQAYSLPSDILDIQGKASIVSVKCGDEPELKYVDEKIFTEQTYDYIGTTLAADIALVDTSFTLTDTSDFASPTGSDTATFNVQGDSITYGTNTKSTGVLSEGADVTSTHSDEDEAWQVWTTGQPIRYTIDSDYIKLDPMPNSTWAGKNLYIEYWKKFPDLDTDADETLFYYPENCYTYLYWQLAIRRKLPMEEQTVRQGAFEFDLEKIVAEDPDFRDVRIEPHNIYPKLY